MHPAIVALAVLGLACFPAFVFILYAIKSGEDNDDQTEDLF